MGYAITRTLRFMCALSAERHGCPAEPWYKLTVNLIVGCVDMYHSATHLDHVGALVCTLSPEKQIFSLSPLSCALASPHPYANEMDHNVYTVREVGWASEPSWGVTSEL